MRSGHQCMSCVWCVSGAGHAASRLPEWKAFCLVTKWGRSPALITALLHPPLHSLLSSLSSSLLSASFLPWTSPPPPPSSPLLLFHSISPSISPLFSLYLRHPLPVSPVLSISAAFTFLKPLSSPSFLSPKAPLSLRLTTSILSPRLCFIYVSALSSTHFMFLHYKWIRQLQTPYTVLLQIQEIIR